MKRIGKFYVRFDDLESGRIGPVLAKMLFVPYRVESILYANRVEFIGTSPLFREVTENLITPEYEIVVNDLAEEITVTVTLITNDSPLFSSDVLWTQHTRIAVGSVLITDDFVEQQVIPTIQDAVSGRDAVLLHPHPEKE